MTSKRITILVGAVLARSSGKQGGNGALLSAAVFPQFLHELRQAFFRILLRVTRDPDAEKPVDVQAAILFALAVQRAERRSRFILAQLLADHQVKQAGVAEAQVLCCLRHSPVEE